MNWHTLSSGVNYSGIILRSLTRWEVSYQKRHKVEFKSTNLLESNLKAHNKKIVQFTTCARYNGCFTLFSFCPITMHRRTKILYQGDLI